ncbi:Kinesin-like protein [Spironucleus salmonicida]|uniref:Kinesin-like protein n=1 Tax=Spironucleus salmonicida TaxID=348837 RepID=V6M085_9EUKA|nr:Kinesin-like protein [Spironucleus salmonicida]|eukprot:EST49446.1 Kinesin [Spironucleus salmonicida]
MAEAASVRVLCRFRPINSRERKEFIEAGKDPEQMVCNFIDEQNLEIELEGGLGTKKYCLDRVYPPGVSQRDVYNMAANDTVKQILQGYNGTILSYGQTGAGKSFSMFGSDVNDDEGKGIIPRSAEDIFNHILHSDNNDIEYSIRCSFLEIYNEQVNDLLARGPDHENLKIRESPDRGIYVENAVETQVCCPEDIITVINIGDSNRAVSATSMNAVSSRSHTVIIINVSQHNKTDNSKQEGKMCLVDLAGSEKIGKTGVVGQRLEEAKNINGSLTALGLCIKALAEASEGKLKGHIPFRDSKLTRLLQESLGGNSKTTLLIAVSPHPFNRDETISTLDFGKRAKCIKNKVKVNATKSVKELMAIIEKLQQQVLGQKQFIDMQSKTIDWYKEKFGESEVKIPTQDDLLLCMSGQQNPISDENGELQTEMIQHEIGSDANIRIASLIAQLEKANEAKYLMKQNYEADIKDLETKLAALPAQQNESAETSQMKQNDAEIELLLQENLEMKEEILNYKQMQTQMEQIQQKIILKDEKCVEFQNLLSEEKSKKILMEQQIQQLTFQNEQEVEEYDQKILTLTADNNRLRGFSDGNDGEKDLTGNENLSLTQKQDIEITKLKQMVISLRNEQSQCQLFKQRLELSNDRFVDSQQQLEQIKYTIMTLEKQNLEYVFLHEQSGSQIQQKEQEIQLLIQRITISDQTNERMLLQIKDLSTLIQKLKQDKHTLSRDKDDQIRKLQLEYDAYKTKIQDSSIQKNFIYKPIQGQNVAQQLASQNPDIVEKLKNLKQGWLTNVD